jgi:hypothetical protein
MNLRMWLRRLEERIGLGEQLPTMAVFDPDTLEVKKAFVGGRWISGGAAAKAVVAAKHRGKSLKAYLFDVEAL